MASNPPSPDQAKAESETEMRGAPAISGSRNAQGALADRMRGHLRSLAAQRACATYQQIARDMGLLPPNTIAQVTAALERLVEEDIAAMRPLIASLVIGKARGGLPAPGFFDCVQRFGRLNAQATAAEAEAFHAVELARAHAYWGGEADADAEGKAE